MHLTTVDTISLEYSLLVIYLQESFDSLLETIGVLSREDFETQLYDDELMNDDEVTDIPCTSAEAKENEAPKIAENQNQR